MLSHFTHISHLSRGLSSDFNLTAAQVIIFFRQNKDFTCPPGDCGAVITRTHLGQTNNTIWKRLSVNKHKRLKGNSFRSGLDFFPLLAQQSRRMAQQSHCLAGRDKKLEILLRALQSVLWNDSCSECSRFEIEISLIFSWDLPAFSSWRDFCVKQNRRHDENRSRLDSAEQQEISRIRNLFSLNYAALCGSNCSAWCTRSFLSRKRCSI